MAVGKLIDSIPRVLVLPMTKESSRSMRRSCRRVPKGGIDQWLRPHLDVLPRDWSHQNGRLLVSRCPPETWDASVAEPKKQGEIVELLINRHLSGYVLSVRGERIVQSNGSANSENQLHHSRSSED